jgi:hypothetical protein
MSNSAARFRRIRQVVRTLLSACLVITLAAGVTDPAIGWFVPLALGGGGLVAVALLARRSRPPHVVFSPDPFATDGAAPDMLNFSHVRVTGIGGLGLLIVAAATALQFPFIGAVVATGAIGGALIALITIRLRRPDDVSPMPPTRSLLFPETGGRPRPGAARTRKSGAEFRVGASEVLLSKAR